MQINLRAHGVNRMQAAKIALADAIIWLWLHQANYDSLFTASFIEPAMLALPSFVLSGALVIGITWARWDRIPRTLRVGTALAAAAVGLGSPCCPSCPPPRSSPTRPWFWAWPCCAVLQPCCA